MKSGEGDGDRTSPAVSKEGPSNIVGGLRRGQKREPEDRRVVLSVRPR